MNEYNECEYVFAVFGFLSFVLALLDLILVISTSSILSLSALSGRANRSPRDILLMNDTFVSNDCRARSDPHVRAAYLYKLEVDDDEVSHGRLKSTSHVN